MELITQLLLNKFAQDRATKDRDAGWAREDAYRAQQREDQLAQNEYMRQDSERRLKLAEEANQRAAEQMRFGQEQSLLSIATNPAVQHFGSASGQGLGAMAADTMLRNSSRVMPSSAQSPTMALGDQLFRVRPQSELQAQAASAGEAEFQRGLERTRRMLQTIAPLAPEGARVSTVSPGSGSVTFASVPQPRVPPRPTRGDVTDAREATAFQAIQAARQAVGGAGASVLGRTDPELQAMASAYAESVGNPALTLTILQMLREQQRNEQSAAKAQTTEVETHGAGGGTPPPGAAPGMFSFRTSR